jgi:RNA polymerase sigma-70 factor (ECF subfamily)
VDSAVVERFACGDADAVRAVYDEFGRLVFAVTHRVLGNRALAEEAIQQTFLQAWRGAASFDSNRELGPWLATIARRVAIDVHRREARRPTVALDVAAPADGAVAHDAALITMPPSIERTEAVWQVREAIDGRSGRSTRPTTSRSGRGSRSLTSRSSR